MSTHRRAGPAEGQNPARIIASPDVRRWIHGVAAATVPLLVSYGVISQHESALWVGLAAAVFGTGSHTLAAVNTPPSDAPPAPAD